MTCSSQKLLDTIVLDSCRELFAAYGLMLEPREGGDVPHDAVLCSVLGFGGSQLRGAVVMVASRRALELSNPVAGSSQRDWICELANQLAGRLKNKLLGMGIEMRLATPAGLSGDSLCPFGLRQRGAYGLGAGPTTVCAWVDGEAVDGFVYPSLAPLDAEIAIAEGEMVLF